MPCQAEVGRGWLAAAWFLLQNLILKLSLTQQIPFSSPASLSSLFSPHFVRLICLSLFHLSPPPSTKTQLYLSICLPEHEESKTNAAWKKAIIKINPHICFAECHHDSDLSPMKNIWGKICLCNGVKDGGLTNCLDVKGQSTIIKSCSHCALLNSTVSEVAATDFCIVYTACLTSTCSRKNMAPETAGRLWTTADLLNPLNSYLNACASLSQTNTWKWELLSASSPF